jgi:hypothetical protein
MARCASSMQLQQKVVAAAQPTWETCCVVVASVASLQGVMLMVASDHPIAFALPVRC